MSPITEASRLSTQTTLEPAPRVEIDGFDSALREAGSRLPNLGQSLLNGIGAFRTDEGGFHAAVDAISSAAAAPPQAAGPVSSAEMFAELGQQQQKSMAVMMQTYSFALEATLVTNAATTFTSSINTLIKTQ